MSILTYRSSRDIFREASTIVSCLSKRLRPAFESAACKGRVYCETKNVCKAVAIACTFALHLIKFKATPARLLQFSSNKLATTAFFNDKSEALRVRSAWTRYG